MSEYYKRIEKIVFRHINTILRRSALFQRLLLPVGDCYEQCGCVEAWAKLSMAFVGIAVGVAKSKSKIKNGQFEELK